MIFIRCVSVVLVGVCPLAAQAPRTGAPSAAAQSEPPAWAMPLGPASTTPFDSVTPRRVPGSTAAFTDLRAHDRYNVPDWYPESHPSMPDVVARLNAEVNAILKVQVFYELEQLFAICAFRRCINSSDHKMRFGCFVCDDPGGLNQVVMAFQLSQFANAPNEQTILRQIVGVQKRRAIETLAGMYKSIHFDTVRHQRDLLIRNKTLTTELPRHRTRDGNQPVSFGQSSPMNAIEWEQNVSRHKELRSRLRAGRICCQRVITRHVRMHDLDVVLLDESRKRSRALCVQCIAEWKGLYVSDGKLKKPCKR